MPLNPLRRSFIYYAPARAGFALAGILPLLMVMPAAAVEFSFAEGEVTGSLDTTLSYGQMYRVQGQDKTNDDTNGNDGNRNFDTGLVSEVFKITSDLEANYQNYGLFVRGTAFYDTQIMDKRNDNTDFRPTQAYPYTDRFTDETRDKAGHSAGILDAYVYGSWDLGNMPLTVKVGRQVFNWGEGIFYRGGINTTNPIDAARFRLPGSELKEVLVPVEAINFNIGLTDNLSLEAFYQWNWKESAIDPVGTYFAETDLFADGGSTGYTAYDNPLLPIVMAQHDLALAAGLLGNGPFGPNAYLDSQNNVFKVVNIGGDINAKNDGQFGIALRYVAEELNLTEFGFYFVNYHAKEPQLVVDLTHYEGVDMAALETFYGALGSLLAPAVTTLDIASNAIGRRNYVEDIRMYGFSFNTTLGKASVFGEIAYRPNMPVAISATNDLLGDLLGQSFFGNTNLGDSNVPDDQACAAISGKQLCRSSLFYNHERVEAYNLSLGTIYSFGPVLGFDSLIGVAEIASEHYRASSLSYTNYEGEVRGFAGRPNGAYVSGYGDDDQIDRDSYGYTLALSGTWNDVYAGVNLSPFAVFKHNFQGNSHQTGNFVEDAMAYSVGLRANYMNSLEAEVQYTEYYGAGQNNSTRDRDNLAVNLKYSF